MKVFMDASALVPLALERDQWAPSVRRHLKALSGAGSVSLVTSTWTYYEALSVTRRAGAQTAAKLRRVVESQVNPIAVDASVETEALRRFFQWIDKTASVVDHANLVLALKIGADALLTFDEDFVPIAAGTGIRLLR